jgi:CheY-like chemotaxis protein
MSALSMSIVRELHIMIDMLIVEDNADISEMLQLVLEMEGYTAARARHGGAALAWLAAQPHLPRAMLVDLSMPEMDGPTFIRRVQEQPALRHIPIIVMTADAEPMTRLRGLPVAALLRKPFQVETLLDHLHALTAQPAAA